MPAVGRRDHARALEHIPVTRYLLRPMDLRRTVCFTEELASCLRWRHFDLCAPGSTVLHGYQPQNKLTGT